MKLVCLALLTVEFFPLPGPVVSGGPARASRAAAAVERPPIVGVAHIGLRTDDLPVARKFYHGVLGFDEPFTVDKPSGGLLLTYFKVNDHQYIEVFPELESATEDRLSHISFETADAQRLRDYLASRGVKVPEASVGRAALWGFGTLR